MTMSLNIWRKYVWFFFFDFSDYQDCISMNNIKGFYPKSRLQAFFFFCVYAGGFPSRTGREIEVWKTGEKKK